MNPRIYITNKNNKEKERICFFVLGLFMLTLVKVEASIPRIPDTNCTNILGQPLNCTDWKLACKYNQDVMPDLAKRNASYQSVRSSMTKYGLVGTRWNVGHIIPDPSKATFEDDEDLAWNLFAQEARDNVKLGHQVVSCYEMSYYCAESHGSCIGPRPTSFPGLEAQSSPQPIPLDPNSSSSSTPSPTSSSSQSGEIKIILGGITGVVVFVAGLASILTVLIKHRLKRGRNINKEEQISMLQIVNQS